MIASMEEVLLEFVFLFYNFHNKVSHDPMQKKNLTPSMNIK